METVFLLQGQISGGVFTHLRFKDSPKLVTVREKYTVVLLISRGMIFFFSTIGFNTSHSVNLRLFAEVCLLCLKEFSHCQIFIFQLNPGQLGL